MFLLFFVLLLLLLFLFYYYGDLLKWIFVLFIILVVEYININISLFMVIKV